MILFQKEKNKTSFPTCSYYVTAAFFSNISLCLFIHRHTYVYIKWQLYYWEHSACISNWELLLVHSGVANDAGEITLVPISMNTTQESKAESPVSLTAQSLIGASPKQTHLTKVQDAHLTGISKPKRTGSLALFYRKVCVHIASEKS